MFEYPRRFNLRSGAATNAPSQKLSRSLAGLGAAALPDSGPQPCRIAGRSLAGLGVDTLSVLVSGLSFGVDIIQKARAFTVTSSTVSARERPAKRQVFTRTRNTHVE